MMNVYAIEIFIAHVADGQMDNVKQAIEARKASLDATWSMYLPEQERLLPLTGAALTSLPLS